MGRGPAVVALVALLVGCEAGEQPVLVDVRTDFVPELEFDAVEVRGAVDADARADTGRDWVAGARVAEATLAEGSHELEVTLRLLGSVVARRRALFQVRAPTSITVLLTRDCRAVECPSGSTCVAGECQDPGCLRGDEEACAEPECDTEPDCPPLDACAGRVCSHGRCLYDGDGVACEEGLVCLPEDGCVLDPRLPADAGVDAGPPDAGVDAGPPDAGPADAGPECVGDGDCDDGSACTLDRCVAFACVYENACAPDQRCRDLGCSVAYDCTPEAGDRDGDGIPDARDPWPDRCNTLVDYQDFPPATSAWTIPAVVTEEPNGYLIGAGAVRRDTTQPSLFVETTVVLGEIENPDQWDATIRLAASTGEILMCHIFRVLAVDMDMTHAYPGMGPRLRLAWRPAPPIPESMGYFIFPPTDGDMSVGVRYTLQLYQDTDGHIFCRLFDDTDTLVGAPSTSRGRFPPPAVGDLSGTLRLNASGRPSTFERVLVTLP